MADPSVTNAGERFLLAWIPLFVAIDPVGLLPVFLGLTRGVTSEERRSIAASAIRTAMAAGIAFMFLGKWIFRVLGIGVADFQIAGGLILFILASADITGKEAPEQLAGRDIGIVPLGLPLIAGPAMLTTLLILIDSVGVFYTLLALAINMSILAVTLRYCDRIANLVGLKGLRAVHKIIALLLAAIAVSMIRRGWQSIGAS